MLKVYSTKALSATIESNGQKLTLDVSKSAHLSRGKALHHSDEKATAFVVDQLQNALTGFCGVERGQDGAREEPAKAVRK